MQTQQQEVRKTPLLDSFGRLHIYKRSVYQDRLGAKMRKVENRDAFVLQEEALAVADRTRVVMKTTMEEKGQSVAPAAALAAVAVTATVGDVG